ncbi:adenine deaminase C-terminal domain-containing protein [Peribacillus frigoritolerans]|uniref:adenine deaminase C-terminal domain-containing protein n=1 Tax=Peribacillus frigoritolerans TaxID=450367 RepID=UPI0035CCCA9D
MNAKANRNELVEVAQGKRPADMFIKGGTVINVYSGEFLQQNIALYKDCIAYVGQNEVKINENTTVIDANGLYVSPGFIETHAHPWVIYNPISITAKVLPLGTTTTVNDNLFFYLHLGHSGFKRLLGELKNLPGNFFWLIRLVSQAKYPGERDWFNKEDIMDLLSSEEVLGTAEVTRWPLIYKGDPVLLDIIDAAKKMGKIADGHNAGCSYEKLNSIAASGISACHEAITAEEALDRLRLGLWTVLRNSSLRPDLSKIIKLITDGQVSTGRILMTTDGPHPTFIEKEGFVDGLVRQAVEYGVPVIEAIQMVTINAATYLKQDDYIGGLAPGKKADILLLPDLVQFRPDIVISNGRIVAENGELTTQMPDFDWNMHFPENTFPFSRGILENPDLYLYPHTSSNDFVPVIHFVSNVITERKNMMLPAKDGYVDLSAQEGLMYAALIDRKGEWVTKGILERFALNLDGMASTFNTTTDLLTIGRKPEAMAKAASRVHELGGGIVIVDDNEIILEIPLQLTGMMTSDPSFDSAVEFNDKLLKVLQARGFPFHDILYTLLFLTCDFLPGLRLNPFGLYDVKSDRILFPSTSMTNFLNKMKA